MGKSDSKSGNVSRGFRINLSKSGVSYGLGDANNLEDVDYEQIISKIKTASTLKVVSTVLVWCFILMLSNQTILIGFFAGIIGIIMKIYLRTKGRVNLIYELDDYAEEMCKSRAELWMGLNNCESLWQIVKEASVDNAKKNAGASANLERETIFIESKLPYYIKSNFDIVKLELDNETIFLMPDIILIKKKGDYLVAGYDEVELEINIVDFVEEEDVDSDATIAGYTWKYVNKNGAPDKRYSDNKQLTVCKYPQLKIVIKDVLSVVLQCSNLQIAQNFYENI